MAVTLNAVMDAGNNGDTHAVSATTSLSTTGITVASGSDRVLVAVLNWGSNSTGTPGSRAATWNGVSMSEAAFVSGTSGSRTESVGIYVLVNPATGAQTLAASWTGSLDCYCSAICFDGADQTTGIDAGNTATASSGLTLNVTGTSDGATVASHIRDGSEPAGAGTGNTLFWDFDSFNPGGGGGYRIGLAGTNTFDFNSGSNTGAARATAGVHVIAAAGGGAAGHPASKRMGGVGFAHGGYQPGGGVMRW